MDGHYWAYGIAFIARVGLKRRDSWCRPSDWMLVIFCCIVSNAGFAHDRGFLHVAGNCGSVWLTCSLACIISLLCLLVSSIRRPSCACSTRNQKEAGQKKRQGSVPAAIVFSFRKCQVEICLFWTNPRWRDLAWTRRRLWESIITRSVRSVEAASCVVVYGSCRVPVCTGSSKEGDEGFEAEPGD